MGGERVAIAAKLGIALVSIGVAIAAGMAFVPPKIAYHTLRDTAHEEVTLAGLPGKTAEDIRGRLHGKAIELGLSDAIDRAAIEVERTSNRVRIHVEYVVVVELLGYTYPWRFVVHEEGAIY